MKIPTVGRMVHYVSYGTPGGEYPQACRAAIVTEVTLDDPLSVRMSLCVLNPTGQFFNVDVPYDGGEAFEVEDPRHGLCDGLAYAGGTWHWPEIV